MTLELAYSLLNAIKNACPVDSGALKASIQKAQFDFEEYVVVIGNESGKEINGVCATMEYASKTNNDKTIEFHGKRFRNPNYHWLNNAIIEWANSNAINIAMESEENE